MEIFILILLLVNIPLYKIIFKQIFTDTDDALESIKYFFTPDIFSLFKGKYLKDKFSEFKLGIFIFLCFILVLVEYAAINYIIQLF